MSAKHIFIDSNVYLRFYAYSEDDIAELEKFRALSEAGKIELYLTEQVDDEIVRNRESEISRALEKFKTSATPPQIPRFAAYLDEADDLNRAAKKLSKAKNALSEKISKDISESTLLADKIIDELKGVSNYIETTNKYLKRAVKRRRLGNPPGKPDSLGDQLNWEMLLGEVPDGSDLHIITLDKDFESKLDAGNPTSFLASEWEDRNGGELHIHKSLGKFAKKFFPEIKLPSDVQKSDAISKLVNSGTFARTHKEIERLDEVFEMITLEEALVLFEALVENSQISWIADDEDVKEFFKKLYDKFATQVPVELDEKLATVTDYLPSVPF